MKQYELPHVRARLNGLVGQILHDAGYAADMLTLGFGPEGAYRLHIQCSYRMATEEAILFDRIDYFRPSEELQASWCAQGLEEDDFPQEWSDEDCRLFEAVKTLRTRLDGTIVEAVDVNQLGDLRVRFAGGVTLLALPMSSAADDESWRFWNDDLWGDQHMVVFGDHVELHGPGKEESRFPE